jgi:large conductance mechanosensitive channel
VLKGFKDFLRRGNVVDLAVAVVVGAAFTAVVTAFTNAFLKPLIQVFSGGGEFAGSFVVSGVVFDYASFVNAVITFLITAAVIYFLVIVPLKIVEERRRRGEEEGSADPTDVELLTEIRDLLREQAARAAATHGRGEVRSQGRDDGRGTAGGAGGRIPQQDR